MGNGREEKEGERKEEEGIQFPQLFCPTFTTVFTGDNAALYRDD